MDATVPAAAARQLGDAGARAAAALAAGEALRAGQRHGVGAHGGARLEREAGVEREAEAAQGSLPVGEHGLLREGGERLGVLERPRERILDHLVDEPPTVGLLRLDDAA